MSLIPFPRVLRELAILSIGCMSVFAVRAEAESLSITVGELGEAIELIAIEPDVISRLALKKIQSQLNTADLRLEDGTILFTDTASNIATDSGCTRTEVRSLATTLTLGSDSRLAVSFENLHKPFNVALALELQIAASGRAKQIIGFRLGSCQDLGNDNFSFSATGNASIGLQLEVRLNPILDESLQSLILRPDVILSGQLDSRTVSVDVDDSLLRKVLEDVIEDQIDDALDEREFASVISGFEEELDRALSRTLDANGALIIGLPVPSDEQVAALYNLLSPDGDLVLSLGYLRAHRLELLAALLAGDDAALNDLLSNSVQCEAAGLLQVELPTPIVYAVTEKGCVTTPLSNAIDFYEDAQCKASVDYFQTSTQDYCDAVLDDNRLGNADSRVEELGRWTLSPGTRFDIGAVPLAGRTQPMTQRINYKQVSTPMGECALEMRIHSKGPVSKSLSSSSGSRRALIAFHGGSWQRRSSGALGIEALAAQFVNEGFVVFAPFYRLIGTAEGSEACNDATLDAVLEDAHDALSWVQENQERYGVRGDPVLFGQSAGGHLAGVLAVERADEVQSAVLFYAPTDFHEFARQLRDGEIETTTGQRILETVVGQTLETLNLQDPLIQRNTLTARVANDVLAVPPVFLLHGQRDTVLPVSQSVRLCNALAGNPDAGPASDTLDNPSPSLRQVINCGALGSELHVIAEGEHALDLCIAEELCLSGSPESAELTRASIERMLLWISTAGLDDEPSQTMNSGSVGIAGLLFLLMWALHRVYQNQYLSHRR